MYNCQLRQVICRYVLLVFCCFPVIVQAQSVMKDLSHQWVLDKVVAVGLTAVDNIVLSDQGDLYATLELRWIGKLVKIDKYGRITYLLSGLNRSDGLFLYQDKLFVTEEVSDGRVLEYDLNTRKLQTLFIADKPEGIDRLKSGPLVISEDKDDGTLFLWSVAKGKQILAQGLKRPEGVCVDSQQAIYVAETVSGRILRYANGRLQTVVTGLNKPDQVECHVDGSVWITEDTNPGRLLRFKNNRLDIIVKGLNFPQGIVLGKNGDVYVAEQGRSRIIKLIRKKR